jgi:sulfonate transport system permease protein
MITAAKSCLSRWRRSSDVLQHLQAVLQRNRNSMKSPGCCAWRATRLRGHFPARRRDLRRSVLALIYAWLGNIGAEYFMSSGVGIGSLMINAQQLLDMPTILCGMVLSVSPARRWIKPDVYWKCATRWRQQEQL